MGEFENWSFEIIMISIVSLIVMFCIVKSIYKLVELIRIVNVLIKIQYKYIESLKELESKSLSIETIAKNTLKNQRKSFDYNNVRISSLNQQIRNLEGMLLPGRSLESKFERNVADSSLLNSSKSRDSLAGAQSFKAASSQLSDNENKANSATVPLVKFLERQMETKNPSVAESNKVVTLSSLFENKNIFRLFPQSAKKRSAVSG